MGEAYSASLDGRTWKMTALKFKLRRAVEQRNQFRLLLRDRQAGLGRPVLIRRDGRNPRAAKFARRLSAARRPPADTISPAAKSIAGINKRNADKIDRTS